MQIARIGGGPTETYPAERVGAKAANIARMAALGLPVPPAFVLPIELCASILRGDADAERLLRDGLSEGIAFLELATGKLFGDRRNPLLVSVRSGAARSMPGMLDTVLNVGCTEAAISGLVRVSGNPHFAWDCRCRFLESHGTVVRGIEPAIFARLASTLAAAEGVETIEALDSEALEHLARDYRDAIEDRDGSLSEEPKEALAEAAQAVYRSWTSDRASTYRRLQHLEGLAGTAVTVQAMVFGNCGPSSGAGVAFSRNPSTGAKGSVIDILFGSQGEDVVSGRRTPQAEDALLRQAPEAATQLRETLQRLEREFRDVQDVEFTIEEGRLFILQTRDAKCTPQAALHFAVDFVNEGLIAPQEALRRLVDVDLDSLARKRLTGVGEPSCLGTGASAGVAVGRAAFDSASAARLAAGGDPVVLIRPDISTADIAGFAASTGIVTAIGARTAHAALVARQMGRPCIVGCSKLAVDVAGRRARFAGSFVEEGDWISIDGDAGAIHLGLGKIVTERPEAELAEVARWREGNGALSRS
jgi:pyruvate,orthophosphate dikinase